MEDELEALLKAICPNTYATVAPAGVSTPYVVWQQTGGRDMSTAENERLMRHARIQISVWAKSPQQASALREQIECALRPHDWPTFQPSAAHHMTYETDTCLHGAQQVWEVWA